MKDTVTVAPTQSGMYVPVGYLTYDLSTLRNLHGNIFSMDAESLLITDYRQIADSIKAKLRKPKI